MHWTLSFSVALPRFPFSSFSMVAFCVGCGVCPTNMFCQASCPVLYVPVLLATLEHANTARASAESAQVLKRDESRVCENRGRSAKYPRRNLKKDADQ